MNLSGLPADLEDSMRQELARGKYQSEADLMAEAVRLLREREHHLEELQKELQPALEALARGEYTEYAETSLRDMIEDVKTQGGYVLPGAVPAPHEPLSPDAPGTGGSR